MGKEKMVLDNFDKIRPYVADSFDNDTFIYTELLDRAKRKGNNGVRLAKTFYHRNKAEFDKQHDDIIRLCDLSGCRAMTRLSPRSFKKTGVVFTRLVVETALTENWQGMKTLYNRALGIVTPSTKLWIVDCDNEEQFERAKNNLQNWIDIIPSKSGNHIIISPFNLQSWTHPDIQIHKDNPTNLYIPEGAA